MNLADPSVSDQRPHQSVFPPAPADHKYSHATAAYSATRAYHGPGSTWGAAGDEPGRSDGRLGFIGRPT